MPASIRQFGCAALGESHWWWQTRSQSKAKVGGDTFVGFDDGHVQRIQDHTFLSWTNTMTICTQQHLFENKRAAFSIRWGLLLGPLKVQDSHDAVYVSTKARHPATTHPCLVERLRNQHRYGISPISFPPQVHVLDIDWDNTTCAYAYLEALWARARGRVSTVRYFSEHNLTLPTRTLQDILIDQIVAWPLQGSVEFLCYRTVSEHNSLYKSQSHGGITCIAENTAQWKLPFAISSSFRE